MQMKRLCVALSVGSLLTSCATRTTPTQALDPVTLDPASVDSRYPTANRAVVIPSASVRMNGVLFIAQGVGPHPNVVLLHGLPGGGGLRDLAEAIRRAGWNVLTFQYRGAWGSEGSFSLAHVLEDVAASVAFVRGPEGAAARGSPDHIVLVGHSMGGWAALMAAANDSRIAGVASIAGWNVGRSGRSLNDPEKFAAEVKAYEGDLLPLHGTSADALTREEFAHANDWDLVKCVPAHRDRPVLLIAGQRDVDTPIAEHHSPVLAELERLKAREVTSFVVDSDHSFSDKRLTVAKMVVSWLETQRQRDMH